MKTKLLIILAALLVGSSAFAQSGSTEPLKGDVNGDGKVDVADINAVISIMKKGEAGYFYLGTTRPTAWGYQTLPGVISTYISIGEASGTTVSVAAGETLYMLCPTGWMDEKNVELKDQLGNSFSFLEDFDAVSISGYAVYKTKVWIDAAIVTLKVTEMRKPLEFGVGTSYDNAVWTTVGQLADNLHVDGISNANGDYLFIKYDSRDEVNNLWINSDIPSQIDLDAPIEDGKYKYRRSEMRGASRSPINYIINKTLDESLTYAFIGPGASAEAVISNLSNATTYYGEGSRIYRFTLLQNDYIYVILPSGTPFIDMYMSGISMWYEQLSDITIGGITYTVRRTAPLYADDYSIMVKYTDIPAYIGAGANANEVAISANMTMNYGGGSVEYSGVVSNDGDNIYILLPEGTPYIGVFAGGQPSAIEDGGTITISGITYTVRYISDVYAWPFTITVKYTNVLAPAYIGAGTSVTEVAVDANKTMNYGSGSRSYTINTADNDYIYIILPAGTPFVDMYMSGFPMWYEQLSDTTIGGITYTVRRSLPSYANNYLIMVKYTN